MGTGIGVPQFWQNFAPSITSLPHDVQNCMVPLAGVTPGSLHNTFHGSSRAGSRKPRPILSASRGPRMITNLGSGTIAYSRFYGMRRGRSTWNGSTIGRSCPSVDDDYSLLPSISEKDCEPKAFLSRLPFVTPDGPLPRGRAPLAQDDLLESSRVSRARLIPFGRSRKRVGNDSALKSRKRLVHPLTADPPTRARHSAQGAVFALSVGLILPASFTNVRGIPEISMPSWGGTGVPSGHGSRLQHASG